MSLNPDPFLLLGGDPEPFPRPPKRPPYKLSLLPNPRNPLFILCPPCSDKLLGTDICRSNPELAPPLDSKVDMDRSYMLANPLPPPPLLLEFIIENPLFLEVPEPPPYPLDLPNPAPDPGSMPPKSKAEVLPIKLDNLEVLELLGNPPTLFAELPLLPKLLLPKPNPFCC